MSPVVHNQGGKHFNRRYNRAFNLLIRSLLPFRFLIGIMSICFYEKSWRGKGKCLSFGSLKIKVVNLLKHVNATNNHLIPVWLMCKTKISSYSRKGELSHSKFLTLPKYLHRHSKSFEANNLPFWVAFTSCQKILMTTLCLEVKILKSHSMAETHPKSVINSTKMKWSICYHFSIVSRKNHSSI